MADPGWYPDPGGRAGHYRFWDGQSWGLSTTTDVPGLSSSGGDAGGPGGPGRGRRSRGTRAVLVATALAVVLVLVVVGALVVRERTRDAADPGTTPTTSAPGGNDGPSSAVPTSPTPSASPTTASPTPTPTAEPVDCPVGDPFSRQPYPEDGQAHGGNLTFPVPDGWTYPGEQTSAFTWAYDVGEADVRVQPNWFASYAVGAVSTADGFEDPRSAAELMLQCTLGSDLYRNVVSPPQPVVRTTTVDGYPAVTLSTVIRVDDDRTTFEGDEVIITVVDLDSPESLAFFWGCAPIGDADLVRQLESTAGELSVG